MVKANNNEVYSEKERALVQKKQRTEELLLNEKNRLQSCVVAFQMRSEAY